MLFRSDEDACYYASSGEVGDGFQIYRIDLKDFSTRLYFSTGSDNTATFWGLFDHEPTVDELLADVGSTSFVIDGNYIYYLQGGRLYKVFRWTGWETVVVPNVEGMHSLPNEIFLLGLSPGALAVYSYLLCCENRETYQCWPSYKTIGNAVRMSTNTVRKYVCELEERQLISTENTSVTTKAGLKRNGNLLYTIRPIQLALDQFYDQQLAQMSVDRKSVV